MIKHHDISNEELVRRLLAGEKPAYTWRKCLYLEWFSNTNGRVVIQSTRLEVERLGERAFELTEEEWQEQAKRNAEEINYFMAQVDDALQVKKPMKRTNLDECFRTETERYHEGSVALFDSIESQGDVTDYA